MELKDILRCVWRIWFACFFGEPEKVEAENHAVAAKDNEAAITSRTFVFPTAIARA